MSDRSYVRTEMLPEADPPISQRGIFKWARENLFDGWFNAILTVLAIYVIFSVLAGIIPWVGNGVWVAGSLQECREILRESIGHTEAACWAVIRDRWLQMLFGFYPTADGFLAVLFNSDALAAAGGYESIFGADANSTVRGDFTRTMKAEMSKFTIFIFGYWRPLMTVILLLVAIAPVLWDNLPRRMLWFSGLYPFLSVWLIWGGSIWMPLMILAGFVLILPALQLTTRVAGGLAGTIAAFLVPIIWWLFLAGLVSRGLHAIIPIGLPVVESKILGGFLISIIIGVSGITLSLPIGILLALGRQANLPILKGLCVGFIEFIRGVPLITLLFTASLLLNYFLPPGTNFDIVLRVIIMVTLFSSAYMAEVIRGGLAALPTGQYEAADSLGLDYWKSQRLIIMPQALKISIPSIVNTFIGLFKDTTLVIFIGIFDILGFTLPIRASTDWNGIYWELFIFIALLFWIVCFSMSRYSQWLERKLRTDNR